MDKFVYIAKPEDEQFEIKDILRHNFTFSSRLRTKLKKNNAIYLNGEPTMGWKKHKAGDVISVRFPDEMSDFEPEDIPVYPVFEDDDLLISSKWQDNAKRLLENTEKKGASFLQAHSPGGNPISGDAASERLIYPSDGSLGTMPERSTIDS